MSNVDAAEIAKFSELAHRWWTPIPNSGHCTRSPLRLKWIDNLATLNGKKARRRCGGGILAEAMAAPAPRSAASPVDKALKVAKLHLYESGRSVDYQLVSPKITPPARGANSTSSPAWKCSSTCRPGLGVAASPSSSSRAAG